MKYILFDMYGVILNEMKGNFRSFIENRKSGVDLEIYFDIYKKVYPKASRGEISLEEFFHSFGFEDPQMSAFDYVENFLSIDENFINFVKKYKKQYKYVLLSNDISEFSKLIRQKYNIDKYFYLSITSADIHLRKPDVNVFNYTLNKIGIKPADCIFIDDNYDNVTTAASIGIRSIMFNRLGYTWNGESVSSFCELDNLLSDDISQMGESEYETASEVIRKSFATAAKEFNLTEQNCPTHGSFIKLSRLLYESKNGSLFFAYYHEGNIIGTLELTDRGNGLWFLGKLSVLPEYRRNGYGKSLLDFADNYVKEKKGIAIFLSIINENLRLREWYEKSGYNYIGFEKFESLPFVSGYMKKEII